MLGFATLMGLGVLLGDVGMLYAQQPPSSRPLGRPPSGPVVSPYLNLVRRGGSPAINYYGIVRPQQQFYREVQRFEGELSTQRSEIRTLEEESGTPATGHAAHFMNYSHFYRFREGSGAGGVSLLRPSASRGSSRVRTSSTPPAALSAPRPLR